MRERNQRQIRTLNNVARAVRDIPLADARARHLREEVLEHQRRVEELEGQNHAAKLEPQYKRGYRRVTKDALREDQMKPLSQRGRKLTREHPELIAPLKVPHKHATTAEIAEAADRMAEALTPHLKFLIAAKYPRNCLDVLRRDARELLAQAEAAEKARSLLSRSNRELTEELALARITINELDLVLRKLKNFPDFEAVWNHARRVSARQGRPTKRRMAARQRAAERRRAQDGAADPG